MSTFRSALVAHGLAKLPLVRKVDWDEADLQSDTDFDSFAVNIDFATAEKSFIFFEMSTVEAPIKVTPRKANNLFEISLIIVFF